MTPPRGLKLPQSSGGTDICRARPIRNEVRLRRRKTPDDTMGGRFAPRFLYSFWKFPRSFWIASRVTSSEIWVVMGNVDLLVVCLFSRMEMAVSSLKMREDGKIYNHLF